MDCPRDASKEKRGPLDLISGRIKKSKVAGFSKRKICIQSVIERELFEQ